MLQTLKKPPKTILKEAIYTKLFSLPTSQKAFNLETDNLDIFNLEDLFSRYVVNFGYPAGFHKISDSKLLRQEMAVAMRNKDCSYDLCAKVAMQALEKGLPYVMFGVSAESRLLKSLSKDVVVEVNRAKSLNFRPVREHTGIVMAQYCLVHETADLILKYFSKRFPTHIVCLKGLRTVYWYMHETVHFKDGLEFSYLDIQRQNTPLLKTSVR
ncbi:MAG: hypothetical protein C4562_03705 [Actinobacteria bacterium]|nr:MAG: hypothetical protein C4562_03705 [Actinomycetota bacterium]